MMGFHGVEDRAKIWLSWLVPQVMNAIFWWLVCPAPIIALTFPLDFSNISPLSRFKIFQMSTQLEKEALIGSIHCDDRDLIWMKTDIVTILSLEIRPIFIFLVQSLTSLMNDERALWAWNKHTLVGCLWPGRMKILQKPPKIGSQLPRRCVSHKTGCDVAQRLWQELPKITSSQAFKLG